MNRQIFHDLKMQASESPFESYTSKQILIFANLIIICSSVSGPKALKKPVSIVNCSEKLQNIFEIGFKKCEVIVQKLLSEKTYFERKNSQT